MMRTLVFTFIGQDSPGLVGKLAATVAAAGGNWLESRMTVLADQFAGIVRVQVADDNAETLAETLLGLKDQGLTISLARAGDETATETGRRVQLSIVGNDRPGIVSEVSRALANRRINVYDMGSSVTSVAMSAEPLFEAHAEIAIPDGVDHDDLLDELEKIADELSVDISLE